MSATIILSPAQAAEEVCHPEQMQIWVHELVVTIGMAGFLRELDHGELNDLHATVEGELRNIIGMAFDHPEARTIKRR